MIVLVIVIASAGLGPEGDAGRGEGLGGRRGLGRQESQETIQGLRCQKSLDLLNA